MTRFEKSICDWMSRHILVITVIIATTLSLLARYIMRDYISRDMRVSLLPWFNQIQSGGGIAALREPVGNYNIPYQTLIAFMTYIPVNPMYQYKILSIFFDYFQAIIIARIVRKTTENTVLASVSYVIAVLLPTVVLNSSLWGQCDSIYSSFCLLSLLFLIENKYDWSLISLGVAFAFKLQAIFYLPFMLFYYVKRKDFCFLKFLWIPIIMIVLSLVGIISGQPLGNVFSIYADQTSIGSMSTNYPSLWAIMIKNYLRNNADFYNELHVYAIVLTVCVLLIIIVILLRSTRIAGSQYIEIAFLLVYTTVFFLPNMHERYGYLYIVIGGIAACRNSQLIPAYIVLLILDMMIYGNYLFKLEPNWQFLSAINFCTYCLCLYHILRPITTNTEID